MCVRPFVGGMSVMLLLFGLLRATYVVYTVLFFLPSMTIGSSWYFDVKKLRNSSMREDFRHAIDPSTIKYGRDGPKV